LTVTFDYTAPSAQSVTIEPLYNASRDCGGKLSTTYVWTLPDASGHPVERAAMPETAFALPAGVPVQLQATTATDAGRCARLELVFAARAN
jgi:hypothetical protein